MISERLSLNWQQLYSTIRKEEWLYGPYCSAEADDSAATDSCADAESETAATAGSDVDLQCDSESNSEAEGDSEIERWPTTTALERVLSEYGISWDGWTSLETLVDAPVADFYGTAAEALKKLQSLETRMPAQLAASKPVLLKVLEIVCIDEAERAVHYAKQKARRERAQQRARTHR
jgi:hypothetical protein